MMAHRCSRRLCTASKANRIAVQRHLYCVNRGCARGCARTPGTTRNVLVAIHRCAADSPRVLRRGRSAIEDLKKAPGASSTYRVQDTRAAPPDKQIRFIPHAAHRRPTFVPAACSNDLRASRGFYLDIRNLPCSRHANQENAPASAHSGEDARRVRGVLPFASRGPMRDVDTCRANTKAASSGSVHAKTANLNELRESCGGRAAGKCMASPSHVMPTVPNTIQEGRISCSTGRR